jgi:quercetin dioxygenase-like cupin family protein
MDHRVWSTEPIEQLGPLIGRQVIHGSTMTVARVILAAGAVVPMHEHEHEQTANVLSGRLRFTIGSAVVEIADGESVLIESGVPHEVEALVDSVVLDIFAPRRDDWIRGDDAYLRS